jgi:hypothetical protein
MKTDLQRTNTVISLILVLLVVYFVLFGPSLKLFIRNSPDWIRYTVYGIVLIVIVAGEVVYVRFRSKKKDD